MKMVGYGKSNMGQESGQFCVVDKVRHVLLRGHGMPFTADLWEM
jgi:hypothetical protein